MSTREYCAAGGQEAPVLRAVHRRVPAAQLPRSSTPPLTHTRTHRLARKLPFDFLVQMCPSQAVQPRKCIALPRPGLALRRFASAADAVVRQVKEIVAEMRGLVEEYRATFLPADAQAPKQSHCRTAALALRRCSCVASCALRLARLCACRALPACPLPRKDVCDIPGSTQCGSTQCASVWSHLWRSHHAH